MDGENSSTLATVGFVHLHMRIIVNFYGNRMLRLKSIMHNGYQWRKNIVANLLHSSPADAAADFGTFPDEKSDYILQ